MKTFGLIALTAFSIFMIVMFVWQSDNLQNYKNDAVDKGYAYYNTTNKEFTWR